MTPPGRDPLLSRLERDSTLVAVALSVAAAAPGLIAYGGVARGQPK